MDALEARQLALKNRPTVSERAEAKARVVKIWVKYAAEKGEFSTIETVKDDIFSDVKRLLEIEGFTVTALREIKSVESVEFSVEW